MNKNLTYNVLSQRLWGSAPIATITKKQLPLEGTTDQLNLLLVPFDGDITALKTLTSTELEKK